MNQVQMAAKLYEARDAMKLLFKDKYHEKIKPYRDKITELMPTRGGEVLPTMIDLCKLVDDGVSTALFMAAAVEMIEG